MSSIKPARKLDRHVFVCMNERDAGHPRGCCKAKDAEGILSEFKEATAKAGLGGRVRAQKSGCLDTCEFGASVVVYPDNVWYGPITKADVAEIVQSHLVGGKPVERLKIPGK